MAISQVMATQAKPMSLAGVDDLIRKLRKMGPEKQVAAALRAAVTAGMRTPRNEAEQQLRTMTSRQKVPKAHKTYRGNVVQPGFAASQIRIATFVSRDKEASKALVGPTAEAFYAVQWVELGVPAYGIPPRPWLVPALEDNKDHSIKIVAQHLRKRIEQLARKRGAA